MSCIAQTTRPIRFENSSATWYDRQVSDSSVWTWCLKAATYSISSYLLLICSSWDNLMITLFNNNQFIRILLRNFFFKKKKNTRNLSQSQIMCFLSEKCRRTPPPLMISNLRSKTVFLCVCVLLLTVRDWQLTILKKINLFRHAFALSSTIWRLSLFSLTKAVVFLYSFVRTII